MMWDNSWTKEYRSDEKLPEEIFHRISDARDTTDASELGLQLLAAKRKLPGASLSEIHDVILIR